MSEQLITLVEIARDRERYLQYFRRRGVKSLDDRDELLQDALVRLCAKVNGPTDRVDVRHLYRALKDARAEWYRRRVRSIASVGASEVEQIAYETTPNVCDLSVIATLPDSDRELLHLVYWECVPQEDVAKRLGVSRTIVSRRLRAIKDKLVCQLRRPA